MPMPRTSAPRAKNVKYDPAFAEEVPDLMAAGKGRAGLAAHFGVAPNAITVWEKEHIEFAEALEIGRAKLAAFWEDLAITTAKTGKGSDKLISHGLRLHNPDWAEEDESKKLRELPNDRQLAQAILVALGLNAGAKLDDVSGALSGIVDLQAEDAELASAPVPETPNPPPVQDALPAPESKPRGPLPKAMKDDPPVKNAPVPAAVQETKKRGRPPSGKPKPAAKRRGRPPKRNFDRLGDLL